LHTCVCMCVVHARTPTPTTTPTHTHPHLPTTHSLPWTPPRTRWCWLSIKSLLTL
jgi:hypothetical protein